MLLSLLGIFEMKLQQLRFVCKVAETLNVSQAATALFTSQSGVSKQIRLLEEELGVAIFVRDKNKILRLTDAGEAIVETGRRMILDATQLYDIAASFSRSTGRPISLATTHLHARYTLPPVIAEFSKQFPSVRLSLVQLLAEEVDGHVAAGRADLGISPNIDERDSQVLRVPLLETKRLLIAPRGHELLQLGNPSLRQISRYPQVTYDARLGNTSNLLREFKRAGLSLQTPITAMDSDVMKAYVTIGLGVAIIHNVAYNPKLDRKLGAIDLSYVLKPVTSYLLLRRGKFMPPEMQALIRALAPELTSAALRNFAHSLPGTGQPDAPSTDGD